MSLRFRFGPYRSPRMAAILEAARQGDYRAPAYSDGWHETRFQLQDRQEVQHALTLAEHLTWHPRAEAYGGGQRIHIHTVLQVLRCYEKSCGPSDWRAHCWQPRPAQFYEDWSVKIGQPIGLSLSLNPFTRQTSIAPLPDSPLPALDRPHRIWIMPCRIPASADISRLHPAPLRAQVEAALIDYECAWCPRLQHLDEWDLNQWGPPGIEDTLTDGAEAP